MIEKSKPCSSVDRTLAKTTSQGYRDPIRWRFLRFGRSAIAKLIPDGFVETFAPQGMAASASTTSIAGRMRSASRERRTDMLSINRDQLPVGQGGFHAGLIVEDGEECHRYVYDCGAMDSYAAALNDGIDGYLAGCAPGSVLHTLFLSHLHADHVNGVERLLAKGRGLPVDTIILPLVSDVDRLMSYARSAAEDPASASTEFYKELVIDPAAALARFGPRQIIFVEPGDRDEDAPGEIEPDFDPDDGPSGATLPGRTEPAWRLVGSGTVSSNDRRVSSATTSRTLVMPHTRALLTRGSASEWLLAPFVDPSFASRRNDFLDWLAAILGVARRGLGRWLLNPMNVRSLVEHRAGDLVTAYHAVETDLNVTSLSLYSGPRQPSFTAANHRMRAGRFTLRTDSPKRTGWLATGDAALGNRKRRDDFLARYGHLLDHVVTLALPHHGSDHNFHEDLLDEIDPILCIAAADAHGKWRHPGTVAVRKVTGRGSFLQVVTADPRSAAGDEVILP